MSLKNIPYESIDEKCREFVEFFNSVGLETSISCEGHKGLNVYKYWIQFSRSVTDEDIKAFIGKLPQPLYCSAECDEKGTKYQLKGKFEKHFYDSLSNDENSMDAIRYCCSLSSDYKMNQNLALKDLEYMKFHILRKTKNNPKT